MKFKVNRFRNRFIVRVEENGDAMLVYKGTILKINETSLDILRKVQLGHSFFELTLDMAKMYEVEQKIIEEDVNYFFKQLVTLGVIGKDEYLEYLKNESL